MSDARAWIGRTVHNWRILRLLGEGGFGAVYEAENTSIAGKRAAVKILHLEMSVNLAIKQRFLNEASAASRAEHENIVQIFDGGITDDGLCYCVMELLRGETLSRLVRGGDRSGLGRQRAINIGIQVAGALAAAHELHIVHRDLKPDNIFVIPRSTNAEFVKVLDFGVAKLRDPERADDDDGSRLTATGMLLGTPPYMSPEQWMTLPDIDGRADIYALGVILCECLTGERPFAASNPYEWMRAHLERPVPDLSAHPAVGASLAALIGRMLAKAREERPQGMGEVIAALRGATDSVPVSAFEATLRPSETLTAVPGTATVSSPAPVARPPVSGVSTAVVTAPGMDAPDIGALAAAGGVESEGRLSGTSLSTSIGELRYGETAPSRRRSGSTALILAVVGVAGLVAAIWGVTTMRGGEGGPGAAAMLPAAVAPVAASAPREASPSPPSPSPSPSPPSPSPQQLQPVDAAAVKTAVAAAVKASPAAVLACHAQAWARNPRLPSRFKLRVSIDATGVPRKIETLAPADAELGSCLTGAAVGWSLPHPAAGDAAPVDVPLELEGADGRGHLLVVTDPPGGAVSVNGTAAGAAPVAVGGLDRAKRARVTIAHPGAPPVTRQIGFSGSSFQVVEFMMQGSGASARAEVHLPAPPAADDDPPLPSAPPVTTPPAPAVAVAPSPPPAAAPAPAARADEPRAAAGDGDEDVDRLVQRAYDRLVADDYAQAQSLAQRANRIRETPKGWKILGGAACGQRDRDTATRAASHLDAAGRQYVKYVCSKNGIELP